MFRLPGWRRQGFRVHNGNWYGMGNGTISSRSSRLFLHALRALRVVISLELGLLLLILPWTPVWDNNYFAQHTAAAHWLLSAYLRGAISGLGLMNLWLGTGEVTQFRH